MDPSEKEILAFFQLPDETVNELRLTVNKLNIGWHAFLIVLYNEFVI